MTAPGSRISIQKPKICKTWYSNSNSWTAASGSRSKNKWTTGTSELIKTTNVEKTAFSKKATSSHLKTIRTRTPTYFCRAKSPAVTFTSKRSCSIAWNWRITSRWTPIFSKITSTTGWTARSTSGIIDWILKISNYGRDGKARSLSQIFPWYDLRCCFQTSLTPLWSGWPWCRTVSSGTRRNKRLSNMSSTRQITHLWSEYWTKLLLDAVNVNFLKRRCIFRWKMKTSMSGSLPVRTSYAP